MVLLLRLVVRVVPVRRDPFEPVDAPVDAGVGGGGEVGAAGFAGAAAFFTGAAFLIGAGALAPQVSQYPSAAIVPVQPGWTQRTGLTASSR